MVVTLVALLLVAYFLLLNPERCSVDIARAVKSAQDVAVLDAVSRDYQKATGHLPHALTDLAPGMVRKIPVDPWGRAYQYEALPAGNFRVYGLGADGKIGGSGAATDLVPGMDTRDIIQSIQGWFSCR